MLKFKTTKIKNDKVVVGFNTGHHGGCSIIAHGKIVSISEERIIRKKYADGYINSLFYCLNALNLKIDDIDLLVSSSYHQKLSPCFMGDLVALGIPKNKFITVDHHVSHAYSAYFLSPFKEAFVVVIDGLGNNKDTESYFLANSNGIKKVGGNDSARSIYKGIGRAYEVFTNFCGWSAQEAGKTMGLSAYGKEKYPNIELYKINCNLQIESLIEGKYLSGAVNFVNSNKINFDKPELGFKNKDAAYFVQARTEKVILDLIEKIKDKYKIKNLCLAGGVFLNSIINKKIIDETGIKNIFIPPCCDDTGQSLGNALYGFHSYFKNPKSIKLNHAYLGKEYSSEEINDVLNKKQKIYPLPYSVKSKDIVVVKSKNIAKEVAKLLFKGNIIGWFQGASEVGPRALGHRSILCAPYPAKMKDVLNNKIKHREAFRPFAPAVMAEHAYKYFDIQTDSPFMLLVARARKNMEKKIPAILHVDNTARIQTVTEKDNGLYYYLIKEFYKLSKIPVILNTSFNDNGEPIVETPRDALNMFCKSKLDYLVIGDYIISKL